jgi:hypothetical protein
VKKDGFGNAKGSQHDLAIDGAFDGPTVVVLRHACAAWEVNDRNNWAHHSRQLNDTGVR